MEHIPAPVQQLLDAAANAGGGVSPSRRRQLRWVAGELALYANTRPGLRPGGPAGWMSPTFIAGYLSAADAGNLRRRGTVEPGSDNRPSPPATRRVRRHCVQLLAAAGQLPDPVPDHVPLPTLLPRVEAKPAYLALAHWRNVADPATATPGEIRAAAMAALTREAGLRTGELAALEPGDFDLKAGTVTYQPRPPAAQILPDPVTVQLSSSTLRLVRRWLEVREVLTRETPRTKSMWVSLAANHNGSGLRRPPGLPLHPIGLRRAHARAVASANFLLAGTPGFEPLPRTPGLLRPGGPAAPDARQDGGPDAGRRAVPDSDGQVAEP